VHGASALLKRAMLLMGHHVGLTIRPSAGAFDNAFEDGPLTGAAFSAQTLSQCLSSPRLVTTSIFRGGSDDVAGHETLKDPKDVGHFIVQPTGTFSQPMRRWADSLTPCLVHPTATLPCGGLVIVARSGCHSWSYPSLQS